MPRRGLGKRQAEIGTGFAQPNRNGAWHARRLLRQQQDAGDQDGADLIDVTQRVEREPAEAFGRVIAQRKRGPAMRDLVQDDRQHHRRDLDDDAGLGEIRRSREQPVPLRGEGRGVEGDAAAVGAVAAGADAGEQFGGDFRHGAQNLLGGVRLARAMERDVAAGGDRLGGEGARRATKRPHGKVV